MVVSKIWTLDFGGVHYATDSLVCMQSPIAIFIIIMLCVVLVIITDLYLEENKHKGKRKQQQQRQALKSIKQSEMGTLLHMGWGALNPKKKLCKKIWGIQ